MNIKEFEKLLNEKVVEKGLNLKDNSSTFYKIKTTIKDMALEILNQIPNTEFETYLGYAEDLNENRVYVEPHYKYWRSGHNYICEIQIHKSLHYTGWNGGQWIVNKVTVTAPNKDVVFEDAYKDYVKEIDRLDKEIEEKKEQERKEREEARLQYEKECIEYAKKVKDYIKENNLNKEEFLRIVYEDYKWRDYLDKV